MRERVQFQNISFPYIAYARYRLVLQVFYEIHRYTLNTIYERWLLNI